MARSMRNQVEAGRRRRAVAGTSMKSITTIVHTPDCTTRFKALMARSMTRSRKVPGPLTARTPGSHAGSIAPVVFDTAWPRTHNRRDSSRPHACAVGGSKRSNVSISATDSPRSVAAANAAQATLVRPDDDGPTTSDTWPRGSPPESARSKASVPSAATASSPRRSGKVEVSVRSSFRSFRRASTAALAAIFTSISLNFRYYSEVKAKVKATAKYPFTVEGGKCCDFWRNRKFNDDYLRWRERAQQR